SPGPCAGGRHLGDGPHPGPGTARRRRPAASHRQRRHRVLKDRSMRGVTVVDHPLVQHKLTRLRDVQTSTKTFRELMREISTLLCYEVTRDLALEQHQIE